MPLHLLVGAAAGTVAGIVNRLGDRRAIGEAILEALRLMFDGISLRGNTDHLLMHHEHSTPLEVGQYNGIFNRFEALPEGIEVVIKDSKNGAPTPILARATTDEHGEIRAVIVQREDHQPSIFFSIEKDESNPAFGFVD